MKKVVFVFTSPRKGANSCTLGSKMMEGAMTNPDNIISIHRLNQMKILNGCQHCNKCKSNGVRCFIQDDVSNVVDDIRTADVVVVTSPLHYNHASSLYYMLEDRLYCILSEAASDKKDKKFVPVVTFDENEEAAKKVMDSLSEFWAHNGFKRTGSMVYRTNGKADSAANDPDALNTAFAIGTKL